MKLVLADNKLIAGITILFTALFVYMLIVDYDLLVFSVEDLSESPIDSIAFLFPYFLLPCGIFLFWQRRNIGWILIAIFLAYTSTVLVIEISNLISWYYSGGEEDMMMLSDGLPIAHMLQLIIMLVAMYLIGRARIRNIFMISVLTMCITITASVIGAIIRFYSI